jgi:hypothetical protein
MSNVHYGFKTSDYVFLVRIVCVVVMQYVTVRQTFYTQHFTIVIENASRFGCTRQPFSGFTFHRYKKEIRIAVAVLKTVKYYDQNLDILT